MLYLSKLGCLSRKQLQVMMGLKTRNMNLILNQMSKYLNHIRLKENVYYLNKKGREMIGATKEFRANNQIAHRMMCNDIYIYYHYPTTWRSEAASIWKEQGKEYKLVSDARFIYHDIVYFVEADHKLPMYKNQRKIELYASLFRTLKRTGEGRDLTLLFFTTTSIRKDKLEKLCAKENVPCEVLTVEDSY
ncbi:replication-relaxation family protein [Priestia koreensis]|uniref:replication-relaxation family protein n=1 Tax=Priestia koreensis TaxID=284581 RepID=UPI003D00BE4C